MRRSWLGVGVLLAVLGSSAACGPFGSSSTAARDAPRSPGAASPGSSGGDSSATSPGANAGGTASPGATAGGAGDAARAGGLSTAPGAGPSAPAFDLAAFCALAKEKGAQNFETFDGQSNTPEEARQVLANIDAVAAAAPVELHDDFALYDDFEHRLADAGGDATGDLAQEAGGQDLRDALNHIDAYLDENCGIHK